MIKVLIVDNELLAGVRIERLLTAMQNIIFVGQATNRSSTMAMVEYAGARSCLYAYSYQGIDVIPIEDVRLLKADQKYVRAYTANTDFTINESLKGLEQEFPNLFIRIHRNALVTKGAIQGIRRIEGCSLVMLDDIDIQPEISRRLEPKLRKLTAQL